ncbi:hypothetical protein GOODEAATRI_029608 [Goodea atripinnis]|uniref:Hyaluronidase n=1 Tax=Goodea atripinnis TaxID=208336 RepID=A0ABV0P8U4_9TELE
MEKTISFGIGKRPSRRWGFYLFPDCYNYGWDKPGYTGECSSKTQKQNNKQLWLWERSTTLFPSVYLHMTLGNSPQAALYLLVLLVLLYGELLGTTIARHCRVNRKREGGHSVIRFVFVELSVHDVPKQLVFDRRGQLFIICCLLEDEFSYILLCLHLPEERTGV